MTLEKLARMTANEFSEIRREVATKDDLKRFATKDDLIALREEMATKSDLEQMEDKIARRIIDSNDKVATKIDIALKELAAHTHSHRRVDDTLLDHEARLKRVEHVG